MIDVMLDLETLGTRPGCPVLSIGAVFFDPDNDGLGAEFYRVISLSSCMEAGLTPEAGTLGWWMQQSSAAQAVLVAATAELKTAPTLSEALWDFDAFLKTGYEAAKVRVWGNGSDFDNAILSECFAAADIPQPWKFYNNRCYRTLKGLFPGVKLERQGTYHNALDDAKSQAVHARELFKMLSAPRLVPATDLDLAAFASDD